MSNQANKIDTIRHSLAHIMAMAVNELWQNPKFGVGPVIENGFYYDVLVDGTISSDDLEKIENKMHEIIDSNQEFVKQEWDFNEAKRYFRKYNQDFKIELIESIEKFGTTDLAEISTEESVISDSDVNNTTVTVYKCGGFVDLCRGPHVKNTSELKSIAYKLDKVSGAYWRGDEKRPQLQRIYGLAFNTEDELKQYEHTQQQARIRDHRKLGRELDLFIFSDLVGSGLPLWTPRGTLVRQMLDNYVAELRSAYEFMPVTIPHITKKNLYEKSGHWAKFGDELFRIKSRENDEFAIKPMNCPHHAQIYAAQPRSYKELPIRYSETTFVYRDEQSGELMGLERTRSFTQDDAHVFCRISQISDEILKIWDIIDQFYSTFDIKTSVRFSRHDPNQLKSYSGTKEVWQMAEEELKAILENKVGEDYVDGAGEAAFYGPKLDFIGVDSLGRSLQVATIQLDFNQPESFELTCVNEKGEQEQIVMIHCAIMGSIERFLAVLIEHYGGVFPLWLAPEQVRVIPVSEKNQDYAEKLSVQLTEQGIRTMLSNNNDSLSKRIASALNLKIPYIVVVGAKESTNHTVSVRTIKDKDLEELDQAKFIEKVVSENIERQ